MISSHSEAGYLILGLHNRKPCFLEQAAFQREVDDQDLHVLHLTAKVFDLAASRDRAEHVQLELG